MATWIEWLSVAVGAGGLIASIIGLIFAFLARRAAKSAEAAANEARQALSRNLSSVDIERAIELINRLKELHRQGNWIHAIWVYQILRRTLSEIRVSMPATLDTFRSTIGGFIPQITEMENRVNRSLHESLGPVHAPEFDAILNTIQQELETLQSHIMYLDNRGGS